MRRFGDRVIFLMFDVLLDVNCLTLFEVDIYYKEAFYNCAYGCTREISFRNWLNYCFAYSESYSTLSLNRSQPSNSLGAILLSDSIHIVNS